MTKGKQNSPEYAVWCSMRSRCLNPKNKSYHRYGGRGITVCERWNSFDLFLEDLGPRPSSKHSLGRQNNDGNYEKSNCAWETAAQQSVNKSTTHRMTIKGQTKSLVEWANDAGIDESTIRCRLRRGLSPELAVFAAVGTTGIEEPKRSHSLLDGAKVKQARDERKKGLSWAQLGRMFNVAPSTIRSAVNGVTWKHVK